MLRLLMIPFFLIFLNYSQAKKKKVEFNITPLKYTIENVKLEEKALETGVVNDTDIATGYFGNRLPTFNITGIQKSFEVRFGTNFSNHYNLGFLYYMNKNLGIFLDTLIYSQFYEQGDTENSQLTVRLFAGAEYSLKAGSIPLEIGAGLILENASSTDENDSSNPWSAFSFGGALYVNTVLYEINSKFVIVSGLYTEFTTGTAKRPGAKGGDDRFYWPPRYVNGGQGVNSEVNYNSFVLSLNLLSFRFFI